MNSKSLSALRSIQKQLSEDYLQFFEGLRAAYPPNSDIYRRTDSVISRIKRSLRLFGRMMGAGGTSATQAELNELTKEVDAINKEKDALAKIARKDNELAGKISAVESKTGISEVDLSVSSSALEGAVEDRTSELKRQAKQAKRGSLLDQYQRALAGFYVMRGAFAPIFGPYAGAVTGVLQSPIVARTLWEGIKAPFSYASGLFGRGGDISSLGGGDDFGLSPTASSTASSRYPGGFSISKGLFDFFNKPAFDAKWTKELLEAAKKGGGVAEGGGEEGLWDKLKGSIFGDAGLLAGFGALSKILFGPIGLVAGFGALAYLLYKAQSQQAEDFKTRQQEADVKAGLGEQQQKLSPLINTALGASSGRLQAIAQKTTGFQTEDELIQWGREAARIQLGLSREEASKLDNEQLRTRARSLANKEEASRLYGPRATMPGSVTNGYLHGISETISSGISSLNNTVGKFIFGSEFKDWESFFKPSERGTSDQKKVDTDIQKNKSLEEMKDAIQKAAEEVVGSLKRIEEKGNQNVGPVGWQGPAGGITRELEQLNRGLYGVKGELV